MRSVPAGAGAVIHRQTNKQKGGRQQTARLFVVRVKVGCHWVPRWGVNTSWQKQTALCRLYDGAENVLIGGNKGDL